MSCEHGLPIASFNLRFVSLVGGRKTLADADVRDHPLESDGYNGSLEVALPRGFIIEVEFLDLKIASPTGGEPCSIWSKRCIQNVTARSAFGRMLSESIYTDITILASDGSIGAHRAVLAAHSPVFDSMFTHDLKEKYSSSISIPDMSIAVCQAFLSYLYSNNIRGQDFIAHRLDLLKAADKYDVTDLKDDCQQSLIEDIDSENVLELLETAFLYRLPRLKFCCMEYLVRLGKVFDIKEEFKAFIQSADKELVSEVIDEMFSTWKGYKIPAALLESSKEHTHDRMNDRVVDTNSRFAQWRIVDSDISPQTSHLFKIGHWNWKFILIKDGNLFIRLVAMSCEHGLPIASFNLRIVSLVGGRKTLVKADIRDRQLKSEGFKGKLEAGKPRGFIIEAEFLDLKSASPTGGEPRSIWSKRCIQNVTAPSAFGRMLSESIHTDITILASDGSIGAHRAVLAAHSPVFDSMFTHDLKEKDSSSISIPDMSIAVCQAFLSYLYFNNTQDQDFIAHRLDLLKAADTYDVTDLKDDCQQSLIEDIDSENVLELLETAFLYRLPRLKFCCMEYLVKLGKVFDIKEEFKAFIQSADKELVSEVNSLFYLLDLEMMNDRVVNMNDRVVDTNSRFARWRIVDLDFSAQSSHLFKIGHWNWKFIVIKDENLFIRLVAISCEHGLPIASFNLRFVSLVGGRKTLAEAGKFTPLENRVTFTFPIKGGVFSSPWFSTILLQYVGAISSSALNFLLCDLDADVRDHQLKSDGFKGSLDAALPREFIIEVEFLDLKIASPTGGEPCSIWSKRCIQNVTARSAFGRMLSESIYTDITILASDGSIGAHRAVLAAHSPVFDSMFTHDLKEKYSSSISIPDMSIAVCQAFLSYLYSNNIRDQDFIAHRLDLLKAADKYDVTDLKDDCQQSLIEDIDSENVLELLETAFLYRLLRLKFCCMEYLVKLGKVFDIKEEFKAFIQSADKELVSEVIDEIFSAWKGV
ncbi:SKP1/BTB/POZ domain-containing protein [Artemisia annua]|uniref:SKP1/BTB/POZ domain-containing protein n=1 Tax=Artemisia annua TaxID=35608 RepID=A0A2U1PFV1_ARTAN|nr:SKP1/BTB/POZ domain-containing protein [Artemisia annua]